VEEQFGGRGGDGYLLAYANAGLSSDGGVRGVGTTKSLRDTIALALTCFCAAMLDFEPLLLSSCAGAKH
jgi:hypothetical protein